MAASRGSPSGVQKGGTAVADEQIVSLTTTQRVVPAAGDALADAPDAPDRDGGDPADRNPLSPLRTTVP